MPHYVTIHHTELNQQDFHCYSKNRNFNCNAIIDVKHFLPKWRVELEGGFKTFEMETQLFLICSDGSEEVVNSISFKSRKKFERPIHNFNTMIDLTQAHFRCKNKTGISPVVMESSSAL